MYKSLLLKLFLFIILLTTGAASSHGQTSDYSVHSNIIYRFTKYMEWPDNPGMKDFVIGVIGETPLFDELVSSTANKKAGNRNIVIKSLKYNQETYDCHILFISEAESSSLKRISALLQGKPVLIVTERNGLALKGSCINFIIVNDKLKLEINKNNIESRNLKIASELLLLGTIVQ